MEGIFMIELRIAGIIIGILAIYFTFLYFKKKIFRNYEFILWTLLWLGFIIIAITPQTFNFVLKTFNLERTSDLIMIIAFIVIYLLSFRNYISNRKLQRSIEEFIRKDALNDIPEKE